MERLTERGSEYVKIKGNTTIFSDTERYRAYLNNAIIRLAAYEDIGLTPEEIMERITQPPNDPLTLEELREMDLEDEK